MAARAATLGIFTFFAQACVGCGGTASPTETAAVETAWYEASSAERYPRYSEHFPPFFTAQAPATWGWILGWGTRWPRRSQVTLYEPDEVGGFGGADGSLADEPNAVRPPGCRT